MALHNLHIVVLLMGITSCLHARGTTFGLIGSSILDLVLLVRTHVSQAGNNTPSRMQQSTLPHSQQLILDLDW